MFVDSLNRLEVQTHEVRFTTGQTARLRLQGGVFLSDLELIEVNKFTYPGSVKAIFPEWRGGLRAELSIDQHPGGAG